MLLNNVLLKTMRDQIRPLKWWSLGISIYCSSVTFLYAAMEDSIGELAEAYPADIAKVFGIDNISDIASPAGWLNVEAYSLMIPICLIIFCVFPPWLVYPIYSIPTNSESVHLSFYHPPH